MLKRVSIFAYGVACYLVSLGIFLYAIGFVGNFLVPRRLDGEPGVPFGVGLAVDLGLVALFALQHSVMARPWFKEPWTKIVPVAAERSTYLLLTSVALGLLFWQWQPLGGTVWDIEAPWGQGAMLTLFAFGWGLVLVCTFLTNHFDLFGLRQVWLELRGVPYSGIPFGARGAYRIVRHPLYVGWLFAFWMTPTMTVTHLVFAVTTTLYIILAIQFEERDLVREHGSSYALYRQHVPMLVPFTSGHAFEEPIAIRPASDSSR